MNPQEKLELTKLVLGLRNAFTHSAAADEAVLGEKVRGIEDFLEKKTAPPTDIHALHEEYIGMQSHLIDSYKKAFENIKKNVK